MFKFDEEVCLNLPMVFIQKLEIETTELFKQKQYSKVVIFEITSQTKEEERSAFLCNLLGLSRLLTIKKIKMLKFSN